MTRALIRLVFLTAALSALPLATPVQAEAPSQEARVLTEPPDTPSPEAHYVFYLHGLILEGGEGRRPRHPQFGIYEYDEVLAALGRRGAVVISEKRRAGVATQRHVEKIIGQIKQLRAAGVPDAHITVVGFSKGGQIAQQISAQLDAPIRYVLMGACPKPAGAGALHGQVVALREKSDLIPTCKPLFAQAAPGTTTREIVVDIGGSHGAFYRPHPSWLKHVLSFIHAQ